jgi:hypothetical protein
MAESHVKIKLANAEPATPEEFASAQSGHQCSPDDPGCQVFADGTKLKVKRAADGSLVLKLSDNK